jgi:hypothetical protein
MSYEEGNRRTTWRTRRSVRTAGSAVVRVGVNCYWVADL